MLGDLDLFLEFFLFENVFLLKMRKEHGATFGRRLQLELKTKELWPESLKHTVDVVSLIHTGKLHDTATGQKVRTILDGGRRTTTRQAKKKPAREGAAGATNPQ